MRHHNVPPRRRLLTPILLVSLCLLAASPSAALQQSADKDDLRSLVDRFFRAVQERDLNTLRRLSSVKSPESSARNVVRDFSASGDVELAEVVTRKLVILGDKATIRAVATMKVAKGRGSSDEKRLDLTFHCTREGGEWRVSTFLQSQDDFAMGLLAAGSEEQRKSLLETNAELVSPTLVAKLVSQGSAVLNRGDFPRALATFRVAASIAEQLGDKSGMVLALGLAAGVHNTQGNYGAALELASRSLEVASESGDEIQIANAKNVLGRTYLLMDRDSDAETNLKSAIAMYEKYGDKRGLAAASTNLALILLDRGDYVQTRSLLERARLLAQETGERSELARAVHYLGNLEIRLGNYANALKHFEASLQIKQDIAEKLTIASTVLNIGIASDSLGNRVKALDYYQRALALAEELGQKSVVALVLGNIGELYYAQNNIRQALEYFQSCLKLQTELGNRRERARMLNSIGNIYATTNRIEAVRFYHDSLEVMKELGDKESVAASLNNLAAIHNGMQEYDKALKTYEESLVIKRELGNKAEIARTLSNIAAVYLSLKNYSKALELATEAARMEQENGASDIYQEAIVRAGHAHRGLGDWNAAARAYHDAIESIESGRKEVVGGEEDEQLFFEGNVRPYLWMVRTLIEQNKYGEALQYAERAQGRVLLDVLRSGKTNVTKAMTPAEQERERQLNQQLVSLNAQRLRGRQADDDPAKLAALEGQIRKARLEFEAFRTGLYAAHPDLKVQRGDIEPFRIEDAAALIGDSNNALLEFVVMEQQTLLFVLTAARRTQSGESERKVDLRLYPIKVERRKLADLARRFRESISGRTAAFRELARELHVLLLEPAREQIANRKGLVVVSVGGLRELPFQALQSPQGKYLLEDYAVSYAPSLSVLREMRKRRLKKGGSAPPLKDLLAFGNPAIGKETSAKLKSVLMDERLEPLPQAEKQVRILGKLYGAGSTVYVGQEALEERLKAQAGSHRVLHLATHGILNDESPMYSQVVLSQTAGKTEDGLLEAREIMNLDLNADLVVLSACETARGKVREGEGMVGLAWAIFVAGSPTTVASQWNVESASTTALMVEFHKNLLARAKEKGEQISKAEALRRAALTLLRTRRYRHPFYWAPFVIVGDGN